MTGIHSNSLAADFLTTQLYPEAKLLLQGVNPFPILLEPARRAELHLCRRSPDTSFRRSRSSLPCAMC